LAFHAYIFTGDLIFKGLTARRLYKSFGVKVVSFKKRCIISCRDRRCNASHVLPLPYSSSLDTHNFVISSSYHFTFTVDAKSVYTPTNQDSRPFVLCILQASEKLQALAALIRVLHITSSYGLEDEVIGVRLLSRMEIVCSAQHPDCLWGPKVLNWSARDNDHVSTSGADTNLTGFLRLTANYETVRVSDYLSLRVSE
jgi:hypothetical protein